MALDDRDYMRDAERRRDPVFYNPKNFRGPSRAPGEELLPGYQSDGWKPARGGIGSLVRGVVRAALILGFVGLVLGTAFHRNDPDPLEWIKRASAVAKQLLRADGVAGSPATAYERPVAVTPARQDVLAQPGPPPATANPQEVVCVAAPPSRSGFWRAQGPVVGAKWIRISNFIDRPAFFVVTEPLDGSRLATAFIRPGESGMLQIRGPQVSLSMRFGTRWCNSQSGWLDGERSSIIGGLRVEDAARGVTMEIRPSATPGERLSLVVEQEWIASPTSKQQDGGVASSRGQSIGSVQFATGGYAMLTRTRQGYNVQGTIARVPVLFLVDTGATITSVPESWAQTFGVTACVPRMFNTANGRTQGCVARVTSITFGPFEVQNAEVAFMKNLSFALLGMNALQQMQVVEQGRDMVLRPK